jgi:hypothetical protein
MRTQGKVSNLLVESNSWASCGCKIHYDQIQIQAAQFLCAACKVCLEINEIGDSMD